LAESSSPQLEAVLVCAPDRLARNYAYQVVVLEELERAGCEVVFLNHGFGNSPEEQMLLQMQGVFAEYERARTEDRTRRGLLYAARQGRVNWGGTSPYGFRYIRKSHSAPQQLLIEESEAEVVRQMYRWLLEERLSSHAIAKRLNQHAVPTRKGSVRGWQQSAVISILRNSMYCGQAYYNKTRIAEAQSTRMQGLAQLHSGRFSSRRRRPPKEWIPVTVPAIIDPSTWQAAQEQLQRNATEARRNNTQHRYLLRSLLFCGSCGRRLVGSWNSTSGGFYRCSARYPRNQPYSCNGRGVAAAEVEPLIWNSVCSLLSNPQLLRSRFEDGHADPAIDLQEQMEQKRIERRLAASEREQQRLIDAYQAEVINLDELRSRRQRIELSSRSLQLRLQELDQQRLEREQQLRLLDGLEQFCSSIHQALDDPPFELKQRVLRLVLDQVIVEQSRIVLRHIIPTHPALLQRGPPGSETPRVGLRTRLQRTPRSCCSWPKRWTQPC
jgi:site-specific DNA recombinase